MSATQNPKLGIGLMVASAAIFAAQDGITRQLGADVNVYMLVTVRFWVFAAFVLLMSARAPGGLRQATRSAHPYLQILRGVLLISEICFMVIAFVNLGLIATHAIFACYPLLVAALSGPILGEKVGWRRWSAIAVGFIGMLIILDPRHGVFTLWSVVPFAGALTFAVYSLLTRYVAAKDPAQVSFFWTGIVGAIVITPLGLMHWQSMSMPDWILMAILCVSAILGHGLLIKAYDVAEASAIQPFAYFQLPFVSMIGVFLFGEVLQINVVIGAIVVVGAGVFTLWRQRLREKQAKSAHSG